MVVFRGSFLYLLWLDWIRVDVDSLRNILDCSLAVKSMRLRGPTQDLR